MAYKDPAVGRARYRERTAERERRLYGPCAGTRREAERLRYAKAKAAGLMYGGKNIGRACRLLGIRVVPTFVLK